MPFQAAKCFLVCFLLLFTRVPGFAQESATSPVLEVPEKETAERLIRFVPGKAPDGAFKMKCSNALVTLDIAIDETGKVSRAQAVSGFDELKEPAVIAVKQWTYKLYLHNGITTAV